MAEMRISAEIIFWVAVVAVAYTYAGYPLLLILISKFGSKPVLRGDSLPSVTVIIAAYNEERDLATKLENTLALHYPKSKLEILVTSDCSTDRTDEIVKSFANRGVRLHRQEERLGKTAAQNAAVEKANGEILLFSDATTHYYPDVLLHLIPSFADNSVGCVTGNVVYAHAEDSSVSHGTRSYWNYEFLLKKHESAITSLIGVCGCMYAVRKSAYVPLYHEACSDFLMATMMVRQGLRAVYEPEAVCIEEPNSKGSKELAVRVRIITQTLADLWRNRDVLNPFHKGFYSVQLISHKVMRYLVPLFLIVVLVTSGLLAFKSIFYAAVFLTQIVFYLAAGASALMVRLGVNSRVLALPQYFVITNIACLLALIKLVRGERYVRWEPVRKRVNA
jgi:cellulose synthase/poly-beta-1,6-N-acetylglucosamine synthase-like glycosyltransferase